MIRNKLHWLLLAVAGSHGAHAGADPAPVRVTAPETLTYCTVCHGVELTGNAAVDAPSLAGLPDWYLERQMRAFREGWRGTHADDPSGMEMRPQAQVLTADQLQAAIRFAASIPARTAPVTLTGDVRRGEALYDSCAACHGTRGEGNAALLAPPLAPQSDWYLARQLERFRAGVRGSAPGDEQGALMRASAATLPDDQAIRDVVAYVKTLQPNEGEPSMNKAAVVTALTLGIATAATGTVSADVIRHPLPDSDFPIAQAVEVPADVTLLYHSGTTPSPADPKAPRFSEEFWGDTEAQANSVLSKIEQSLAAKGSSLADVVKMVVFLVGVPEKHGAMDFDGFMRAYTRYFGTEEQPNLPARSAVQVAGLAAPGMLVEVEVVAVRPGTRS